MGEVLLEVKNMCKNYGPITALKNVDLKISRGEVHGLVGENGSGKSTITSIAAGMQPRTSGEMIFRGKEWNPTSMIEAQHNGLSMILQEANTIPGCTKYSMFPVLWHVAGVPFTELIERIIGFGYERHHA